MKPNTTATVPIQTTRIPGLPAARPKITPSWALQGMANARSTVAIRRRGIRSRSRVFTRALHSDRFSPQA